MNRNVLTFINHACFEIRTDDALLLIDPWVEGTAFNHGWSLLDQSTSNAALGGKRRSNCVSSIPQCRPRYP